MAETEDLVDPDLDAWCRRVWFKGFWEKIQEWCPQHSPKEHIRSVHLKCKCDSEAEGLKESFEQWREWSMRQEAQRVGLVTNAGNGDLVCGEDI